MPIKSNWFIFHVLPWMNDRKVAIVITSWDAIFVFDEFPLLIGDSQVTLLQKRIVVLGRNGGP